MRTFGYLSLIDWFHLLFIYAYLCLIRNIGLYTEFSHVSDWSENRSVRWLSSSDFCPRQVQVASLVPRIEVPLWCASSQFQKRSIQTGRGKFTSCFRFPVEWFDVELKVNEELSNVNWVKMCMRLSLNVSLRISAFWVMCKENETSKEKYEWFIHLACVCVCMRVHLHGSLFQCDKRSLTNNTSKNYE